MRVELISLHGTKCRYYSQFGSTAFLESSAAEMLGESLSRVRVHLENYEKPHVTLMTELTWRVTCSIRTHCFLITRLDIICLLGTRNLAWDD